MKKYLLPSALILVLGLGIALAQNITKSVQLSQDPTGPIGYDTNNNVYFPGHILSTGVAGIPTVSAPVGTAPTILAGSTDFIGQITGGSATNTTASITFKTAFAAAAKCLLVQSGGSASTLAYNTATTGINITSNLGTGVFNYLCSGAR